MEQLSSGSTGLPGDCGDESQNLVSIVRNFIANDVAFQNFDVDQSIASFADPAFASKLAALSFFFGGHGKSTYRIRCYCSDYHEELGVGG